MALVEVLAPIGAGSLAYWAYFHRGEHFLYGTRYMQLFLMTVAAGTVFFMNSKQIPLGIAFSTCLKFGGLFLVGCYTNCVIYASIIRFH